MTSPVRGASKIKSTGINEKERSINNKQFALKIAGIAATIIAIVGLIACTGQYTGNASLIDFHNITFNAFTNIEAISTTSAVGALAIGLFAIRERYLTFQEYKTFNKRRNILNKSSPIIPIDKLTKAFEAIKQKVYKASIKGQSYTFTSDDEAYIEMAKDTLDNIQKSRDELAEEYTQATNSRDLIDNQDTIALLDRIIYTLTPAKNMTTSGRIKENTSSLLLTREFR